jgi:hypothetical protein
VGRFIALLVLGTLLVACQNGATQAPRSSGPSPHPKVTAAVLQAGEAPAGLTACPGSGPIGGYLTTLQTSNPTLASRLTDQWQLLRSHGAVDAAVALFAADPAACSVELGVSAKIRAAASFVALFADEGQAERAWGSGIFGFAPPAPDLLSPGLVRGNATGRGASSWTYTRPSLQLASWRRSVFVSLVVLTNLDTNAFKSVTAAIDARLN